MSVCEVYAGVRVCVSARMRVHFTFLCHTLSSIFIVADQISEIISSTRKPVKGSKGEAKRNVSLQIAMLSCAGLLESVRNG